MRALIKDIITKKQASYFLKNTFNKYNFDDSCLLKVINKCSSLFDKKINLSKPSYWYVDSGKNGHNWHKDTGSNNHMLWCNYGISIGLSSPDKVEGGIFEYKNPSAVITPNEHFLSAIIHDNNQEHKVSKSKNRSVLLLFLG